MERLSFLDTEGQGGYRYGKAVRETETMDHLELIARVTSHIPDKGQDMIRYYGLYANARRGKVRKARFVPVALGRLEEELRRVPAKDWSAKRVRMIASRRPGSAGPGRLSAASAAHELARRPNCPR